MLFDIWIVEISIFCLREFDPDWVFSQNILIVSGILINIVPTDLVFGYIF